MGDRGESVRSKFPLNTSREAASSMVIGVLQWYCPHKELGALGVDFSWKLKE